MYMLPVKYKLMFNMLVSLLRLSTEHKGGAWCPKTPISKGVYEYLEVDLGELSVITRVETQGRFGNGQVRLIF